MNPYYGVILAETDEGLLATVDPVDPEQKEKRSMLTYYDAVFKDEFYLKQFLFISGARELIRGG